MRFLRTAAGLGLAAVACGTSVVQDTHAATTSGAGGAASSSSSDAATTSTSGTGGATTSTTTTGTGGGGGSDAAWSEVFGAVSSMGDALAVDPAGNIAVTGRFYGTMDLGSGAITSIPAGSNFVASFDPAGHARWTRRFGYMTSMWMSPVPFWVAADDAGEVLLAGPLGVPSLPFDFGGGPLQGTGGQDIGVAKLDAAGAFVWGKRFGNGSDQQPGPIAPTPGGGVVLTGYFAGTLDFGNGPLVSDPNGDPSVVELDASGEGVWSEHFGTSPATAIAVDAAGVLVLAGNSPASLARLDPSGHPLWTIELGDAQSLCFAESVAVSAAGDIAVTGTFEGTIDLGSGPFTSQNGLFLAVRDAAGGPRWGKVWSGPAGAGLGVGGALVGFDPLGHLVMGGGFEGTLDLGGGPLVVTTQSLGVFVARFDAQGTLLASERFEGSGATSVLTVMSLAPARVGDDVALTGTLDGQTDFGQGPLQSSSSSDGEFFLAKLTH